MKAAVTVKENHEFRRIYRKGRSAVSPYLVVYCQKNREGRSRLGVTVSKKLGHAVVRNRVRRRIREIYRLHEDELHPGWDMVIVARVKAAHGRFSALERSYLSLTDKLGVRDREEARP